MHTEFNVLKKMYFEIIIIMNSLAENVLVTTS